MNIKAFAFAACAIVSMSANATGWITYDDGSVERTIEVDGATKNTVGSAITVLNDVVKFISVDFSCTKELGQPYELVVRVHGQKIRMIVACENAIARTFTPASIAGNDYMMDILTNENTLRVDAMFTVDARGFSKAYGEATAENIL